MASSTAKDARVLISSLRSAYSSTPTKLKIIDVYVVYAIFTAVFQVIYMAIVGTFPFNAFLSSTVMHWNGCACSLFTDASEQRKQGIQGSSPRKSICRFCSLQYRTSPGDNELLRLADTIFEREV